MKKPKLRLLPGTPSEVSEDAVTASLADSGTVHQGIRAIYDSKQFSLIKSNPFKGTPIVPKKMIWTGSSLKQFRDCPRKFFWKYIMRLRNKLQAGPLMIGSQFHECLGKWYSSRFNSMSKLIKKPVKDLREHLTVHGQYYDTDDLAKFEASVGTFEGMMLGYAEVNADDRKEWRFDRDLGTERQFLIDCGAFYFAGSIDGVFRKRGNQLWMIEHKTARLINDVYIQRLKLDTQTRGYLFALLVLGFNPIGAVYNVTQKCALRRKSNESVGDFCERIKRAYMSEPTKYFFRANLVFEIDEIVAFYLEMCQTHDHFMAMASHMAALEPRSWPINDKHCDSYFKLCEYHQLCTEGLDFGTSLHLEQHDKLHVELGEGDIIE